MNLSNPEIVAIEREYGHAVFPGHALTIACYALTAFPTIDAALEPTEHGWTRLQGSSDVPGAGDGASAAAELLRYVRSGLPLEELIVNADEQWERRIRGQSPAFDKYLQPGLDQAERMKPLFRDLVRARLTLPAAL